MWRATPEELNGVVCPRTPAVPLSPEKLEFSTQRADSDAEDQAPPLTWSSVPYCLAIANGW